VKSRIGPICTQRKCGRERAIKICFGFTKRGKGTERNWKNKNPLNFEMGNMGERKGKCRDAITPKGAAQICEKWGKY
jgi:hypothetical protein